MNFLILPGFKLCVGDHWCGFAAIASRLCSLIAYYIHRMCVLNTGCSNIILLSIQIEDPLLLSIAVSCYGFILNTYWLDCSCTVYLVLGNIDNIRFWLIFNDLFLFML